MKKLLSRSLVGLSFLVLFAGWGSVGHKIINRNITASFPSEMVDFKVWSTTLESHASDADNRKSADKTEAPKHYIDIDYYPEFVTNHRIPQTLDSMNAIYTATVVLDQGILPFAILTTMDSLRAAFQRRDFSRAVLVAADLGHYVGDGHQPLHVTQNYDGAMTNQSGIHSRYETTLIGAYQSSIVYTYSDAVYIPDVKNYVFDFIYHTNSLVDSILYSDSLAKATLGSTSGSAYTAFMWNRTSVLTNKLFNDASYKLACLIYTAWKDAGSPQMVTGVKEVSTQTKKSFALSAYPNPFNGQVTFSFPVQETLGADAALIIYDLMGREVDRIAGIDMQTVGSIKYTANNLSSGAYLAALSSGKGILSAVKFVLMK